MKTTQQQDPDYFSRLFNGIADAVLIAERRADGTPGRYIEVNDVACRLLGLSREQLLQLTPYDLNRVAMEDAEAFAAILDDIAASDKTLFKTDLRHHDGRWIAVEIGSQLFTLNDRLVYFSVARDISIREQYEESIKTLVRCTVGLTGQDCLEEIVVNLCRWLQADGATIALVHDGYLEQRAGFCRGGGQPARRAAVDDFPAGDLLEGRFCWYPDNARELFSGSDFFPINDITGFIGSPMLSDDGRVLGFVCSYAARPLQNIPHVEELMAVIASRAAAECERMRYERELAHSEEMLRTLFSSTAEAIVGLDLMGRVLFCNPSAVRILGYAGEGDLIGRDFCRLIALDTSGEDTADNDCPFIAAISRGEKITSEDGFFTHRDGRPIPVEYWGHPMYREQRLTGAVITFIDISRRKTLEQQLQHSQRMEAIGTLTGGIAHDFNNILTVISGYVGLLQSLYADDPQLQRKIRKIADAAERGSKLTHGLLAYSRKKSNPSTPVDLNQLILKVQELFGQVIGESIQQTLTLAPEKLVVLADPSQLEQVLVNLATNARDAMPQGGVLAMSTEQTRIDRTFCQTHGYGEPGDYALIRVEDTGIGIPEEIRQKIFDPFFTTKDTGKGTGLGLAMAWGIVKQHKGYILVRDNRERGSCFEIYLPLTDQPLPEAFDLPGADLPGGKEILLLVEDDPMVRESTGSILTAVGYQVVARDRAESALEILEEGRPVPQLILSDVVMPGIKGPEFYQQIRRLTDIPVIFMSGYTFDALHEQGLVRDGVELLNKPIQPLDLLTRIRRALDKNRQQEC